MNPVVRTAVAIVSGISVAITVAQGCGQSGQAACVAAGGQCVIPNLNCAKVGPQDCNPDRNPGGAYCCLAEMDAALRQGPEEGAPADAGTATDASTCMDAMIAATDYDQTCAVDSDCVGVGVGNACFVCEIGCMNSAIGKSAEAKYRSDVAKSPANGADCGCAAFPPGPCCVGGKCQVGSPCVRAIPAVDAAADTAADAGVADTLASDAAEGSTE
jgi:hypothetical protein